MFGFGRLAGYDYFHHVRDALAQRFADAGIEATFDDVPAPPTSSLRFRSRVLARTVTRTASEDRAPIHLIGHSTGGLDARLVLSPTTNLGIAPELMSFTPRVASAITINAPHYGTPLAGYFTTASGARVLYALSLLTVVSLSIGEPSLAVFSKLLAGIGSVDSLFAGDLKLVSRVTDRILRFVDARGRAEITQFLGKIRSDQGALVQIMPEAMDLFNAAAEDNPAVRYGSVVTAAPPPRPVKLALRIRSPYAALTAAMYSTLYQLASQRPLPYPYAEPSSEQQRILSQGIERLVDDTSNDGIVPTRSMLWGQLLWAGEADHLDVLGHFHDDERPARHVDWMTSGANFTRRRFAAVMDAVAQFLIAR
jgi:triacylglycerol lipase